jgi:uncharacterized repeat protein (TIGR03803 family)
MRQECVRGIGTAGWAFATVRCHALFRFLLMCVLLFGVGLPQAASAAKYKVLHQFCADQDTCPDGFLLAAPLVRGPDGRLYGTAAQGGATFFGTIFRLSPSGGKKWKLTVLHSFCAENGCPDGFGPHTPVILDQQGNLYGVADANFQAENGGAVVYKLHPNANGKTWDYSVLYEFCPSGVCDGFSLAAGLAYVGQSTGALYDGVSPLFGTASAGGKHNAGLVYMLTPQKHGWKHEDIYDFCSIGDTCTDGSTPNQPVIVQEAHKLVGVTAFGGAAEHGVAFSLSSPDGQAWTESVLHAFCSLEKCADGGSSPSALATDAEGNLYGTTPSGGLCESDFACGTIFKIAPDGSETVVFDFCKRVGGCKLGSDPGSGVTLGGDGTIYGTVAASRAGRGLIYAFDGQPRVLHYFCKQGCPSGGGGSASPMILDPAGNLFGVTPQGDTSGGGVIYELQP